MSTIDKETETVSSNTDASGSNKKVLIPQVGNPTSIYGWYFTHHGLQEKELTSGVRGMEQFKRILSLYYPIATRLLEKLRAQFIHDPETYNSYVRKLETRLDNKIRVEPEGKRYLLVNGKWRFDGSPEQYEEWFQGGKGKFKQIFLEVARELIQSLTNEAPTEEHSALLQGDTNPVVQPKEPEIIAVDLDNTLVDEFDKALDGAKEAMQKLKDHGFKLVIYTARFSAVPPEEYQSMMANVAHILNTNSIPYDEISVSKPQAKYFIDDRGVKFTNWDDVMNLVQEDGPQDMEPSKLQKTKVPASGDQLEETTTISLTGEFQHVEAPYKKKGFRLLTPQDIARKASEKMNQELW